MDLFDLSVPFSGFTRCRAAVGRFVAVRALFRSPGQVGGLDLDLNRMALVEGQWETAPQPFVTFDIRCYAAMSGVPLMSWIQASKIQHVGWFSCVSAIGV